MDDELRMLLADRGAPIALAECIVDNFKAMQIPVPILEIAKAVGILEVEPAAVDNFEGVLVTDDGKTQGLITFNRASSLERQRYTIAHEIGHFLMPSHTAGAECGRADMGTIKTSASSRSKEAEANLFASALLMPKKIFLG